MFLAANTCSKTEKPADLQTDRCSDNLPEESGKRLAFLHEPTDYDSRYRWDLRNFLLLGKQ
jgi:hypothetical protein